LWQGASFEFGLGHYYRAAIYEPNPEKVSTLAEQAEEAIKFRMRELMTAVGSSATQEMSRLSDALEVVRGLMRR